MSNNYYDATGILIFSDGNANVTPVIRALFGTFEMDETTPGEGQVYIANMSEATSSTWNSVADSIATHREALGIALPDGAEEDDIAAWLTQLGAKFGVQDEKFLQLLESDFDCEADLASLYDLAQWCNDGHNLKALDVEGAWHSDRPRLHEFGGDGMYLSDLVQVTRSSSRARELGSDLEAALANNDTIKAGQIVGKEVGRLLASISNQQFREAIAETVAAALPDLARRLALPTADHVDESEDPDAPSMGSN
jgi:hypothetical protein